MMTDGHGVLREIGNTPLIQLREVVRGLDAEVLVKAEYLNPSGSIKDRIALNMVEGAERSGRLKRGYTIVEASTGNTAAALALVAAVKGYRLRVFAPDVVASPERMRIVQSYGAEIEFLETPGRNESKGDTSAHGADIEVTARQRCLEIERTDSTVWWARQFSNPDNVAAHREGTGTEILKQTEGQLHAFVASVGTGGTLMGVAEALLAHDPKIEIVGVEPAAAGMGYLRRGLDDSVFLPGITDGIVLDILKTNVAASVFIVTDKDAIDMAHQLCEKEGLFCGISSGANVLVALRVAKRLGKGARVVTVLPDNRDRYLSMEKYTT